MHRVLGIILAGGEGSRLNILSEKRAKPAMPFGGKYRIIDFTLSNCVNSGIYNIQVMTQYRPRSLDDHIGAGDPWDLNRLYTGVELLQPARGYEGGLGGWYRGTADAIYQNIQYVREKPCSDVLVLSGDHIYKMNYAKMVDLHRKKQADLTVAVIPVPLKEASRFGIMQTNAEGQIIDFEEKPKHPKSNLASMGIYVFDKETLLQELREDAHKEGSSHDFGKDIIPKLVREQKRIFTYHFEGYWRDVGTIQSYWEANMDLLAPAPELNLHDQSWVIHTRSEEKPPVRLVGQNAAIRESLVSNGSVVRGKVENSVLSPGVVVEEGAVVKHSIIMNNTQIGKNCVVDHAILDKHIVVHPNSRIGYGDDMTSNYLYPSHLNTGITIVGKNAHIPEGITIGRNCRIGTDVQHADFQGKTLIASGQTIGV
ncbi:MAG: glucose-1-phosphate adenylyltransferase [Gemmatimonadetes bacterium]|nr:MAG: glucose-1-phosphate adenylyltransferase [Gemmatimonadota bacterium]